MASIHYLYVDLSRAMRFPCFVLNLCVGDFFPAIFNCPHEVERVGNMGDGGRWLCGLSRIEDKPDCIAYSFGALLSHF